MRPLTAARCALWAITAVVWVALGRLALAFLGNELHWRYVAEQSRRDAPWYYRLAGVWGGSEGSLLLFAGVLALVASVAARRLRRPRAIWFATLTVVGITAIVLGWVSPFGRLDTPAVRGFGLTPILEHPAMAVHPPLLYLGLGCTLGAAMVVLDGGVPTAWLRHSLGLVTLAMALGGLWSYVEQGWGGYWAWDPVENTSLLVWLAAIVSLHLPRWPRLALLPWVFTLLGACLVRSGVTPSIHGFAEQASVGWALLALTLVSCAALWRLSPGDCVSEAGRVSPVPVVAALAVLGLVAAGTALPVLIDLFADRATAVRGVFYSRTVGPVALVTLPFLVLRLRTPRARLAHIGMVVLVLGIAATTFDREEVVTLGEGQTQQVAGLAVTGRGVAVEPGPRPDVQAVVATVEVDGFVMRPSLVAYPERGGVLAETAMVTRPWRDVQVTLVDATDDGFARLIVRQRPLMWCVWLGAVLTAVGALSPGWVARRRRRPGEHASAPVAR